MCPQSHTDHPGWLADALALRALRGMDAMGRVLLEGLRLNRGALSANQSFETLIYAPEFFFDRRSGELVTELEGRGVPAHRVPPKTFSRLSYKADGLVGVVRFEIPPLGDAGTFDRDAPLIVLDALSDPGNIGAAIRVANAWGASGVFVVDAAPKLYHPKCLRASMGAIFHTPARPLSRPQALDWVRRLGWPVLLLRPDGGSTLDETTLGSRVVFVVGNERRGVHETWNELARSAVAIPMVGMVDSLNAATALAVTLWESHRRRSTPDGRRA